MSENSSAQIEAHECVGVVLGGNRTDSPVLDRADAGNTGPRDNRHHGHHYSLHLSAGKT